MRVEILELRRRLRIGLVHYRLHSGAHDVRHAFQLIRLRQHVIDALDVRLVLLVVCYVCLHCKSLVVVEALDGFRLRLDDGLRQLRIGYDRLSREQVDSGGIDVVVIAHIGDHLVTLLLEREVGRSGQQRGIGPSAR